MSFERLEWEFRRLVSLMELTRDSLLGIWMDSTKSCSVLYSLSNLMRSELTRLRN